MDDQKIIEERVRSQTRLVSQAYAGQLDSLECPDCRHPAGSVWFAHPAANTYRTWFICADCDFHTRVQELTKPPFFSADRVSTDLQERDLLTLKGARFKRPSQELM